MFTVLPLVSGVEAAIPSVPLLLLTGLLGDAAAVVVLGCAENADGTFSLVRSTKKEERANRMLRILCGTIIGALSSGIGMILVANGRLSAASYCSYALPTIAVVQLAVLAISLVVSHCKLLGKPFVIFATATALLCSIPYLLAYFTVPPVIGEAASMLFGATSAHKLVILCAPVGAAVTCTLLVFARKLAKNAEGSGLFRD
jgi:hypothetical protein